MEQQIQAVITAIKVWLVARLNALKVKIAAVETKVDTLTGTVTSFIGSTNTALGNRYTKTETDGKYLGKTEQAVDAAKLGGQTKAQILAEAAMATEAAVQTVRETTQKDTIVVTLTENASFNLLDILDNANLTNGLEDDGTVVIHIKGSYAHTGTLDSANGKVMSGGGTTQEVKAGDMFVVKLTDGTVVGTKYAPDATKQAIEALTAVTTDHETRIVTLETAFGDIDGTFATDQSVDDKRLADWTFFLNSLENSGYTDPN